MALAAWWTLRAQGDELVLALTAVTWWQVVLSTVLVAGGLGVTGVVWAQVLAAHGPTLPVRATNCIFFVGQLGKYVPGSVWSIGVQAAMARTFAVVPRVTVSTSLVFLTLHVATGLVLGGAMLPWLGLSGQMSRGAQLGVAAACLGVGAVALVPEVLRRVTRRTLRLPISWSSSDAGRAVALMALAWALYVAALLVLLPADSAEPVGAELLSALTAAFALGYVVGVAVPVAPAGLGARELAFVVVLSPVVGVVEAAALTALARLVHTVADFLVAGVAWQLGHSGGR